MSEIKVFCLYPNEGSAKVATIDGEDYKAYLRLLKCDIFDIVSRCVCGTDFDIYCDDMGLFAHDPATSFVDASRDENYSIVGNIIFAHHDEEGNTTGLSDAEIRLLQDRIFWSSRDGKLNCAIIG